MTCPFVAFWGRKCISYCDNSMAHLVSRPLRAEGLVMRTERIDLRYDIDSLPRQVVSHLLDSEHKGKTFLFDRVVAVFCSDHGSTQVVDGLFVALVIFLSKEGT